MYRDLVGDPERCTAGGRDWLVQVLCRWTGELDTVLLFDADGELAGEFVSKDAALKFIEARAMLQK